MSNNHIHSHNCAHSNSTTQQTLDELDFERGIWSAALAGDVAALAKHIRNGHLEDRDSSGYTGRF